MNKNIIDSDDIVLINNIRDKNCSESMSILIDRYKDAFYDTIHRFNKRNNINYIRDLLDDMYIVFNKSVKSYNPDKGTKFSTWLSHMARFHCLDMNKENNMLINYEVSDIDRLNESQNKFVTFKDNMIEINDYLFNILKQMDDKRIADIYMLRYIEGGSKGKLMKWSDVAKRVGVSSCHAIKLSEKGKSFLYNKLTSKDICDKI